MKGQTQDIGQCSCEMGRSHLNFLSTPSPFGVTQVAGALVFIGTTAYDLFTD